MFSRWPLAGSRWSLFGGLTVITKCHETVLCYPMNYIKVYFVMFVLLVLSESVCPVCMCVRVSVNVLPKIAVRLRVMRWEGSTTRWQQLPSLLLHHRPVPPSPLKQSHWFSTDGDAKIKVNSFWGVREANLLPCWLLLLFFLKTLERLFSSWMLIFSVGKKSLRHQGQDKKTETELIMFLSNK